jgi:hypothetical protein
VTTQIRPTWAEFCKTWLPRVENHMWFHKHTFRASPHESVVELDGLLKPQPTEGGGRAARRMFLDVFEQLLEDLAELGAVHAEHPDFRFEGIVIHHLDKPNYLATHRCPVTLNILVRL